MQARSEKFMRDQWRLRCKLEANRDKRNQILNSGAHMLSASRGDRDQWR